MLGISKEGEDGGFHRYTCKMCNEMSDNIKTIPHDKDCSVVDPDSTPIQVYEESVQQIRSLIFKIESKMERQDVDYISEITDDIEKIQGAKWIDSGSTSRIAIGLGRTTTHGKFHRNDRRGIVVKYDPSHRFSDITPASGNFDEIETWIRSLETNTSEYFADIFGCAKDGAWLVMEECIPIYIQHKESMYHRDGLWDKDNEKIGRFRIMLQSEGWEDLDYKHGNIGVDDSGNMKIIDFGTGPDYRK